MTASDGATSRVPPQGRDRAKLLLARYLEVRRRTEALCEPLLAEDYGMQPMLEASPPKWHLAHTTWFFEALFLRPFIRSYRTYDPYYDFLFNSYYKSAGPHLDRSRRGLLCRPTTYEIRNYRRSIDAAIEEALETAAPEVSESERPIAGAGSGVSSASQKMLDILELGINHEQQHQELLLTDIKSIFWSNPLRPTYSRAQESGPEQPAQHRPSGEWIEIPGGIREIGSAGDAFAYDHERPRHRVFLESFRIASGLVTNAEYLEFMEAGGYRNPLLWLSDGWDLVQARGWEAPLYWERHGAGWQHFTLSGMRRIDPDEPVCHVSFFEADAFANWKRARLPTEAEWEIAATGTPVEGNFVETGNLHPLPRYAHGAHSTSDEFQFWGDVWEWTGSAYRPYPGFRPLEGTLGEYNGKFMSNQMVLRGGSCATPVSHLRPSYRNYFDPAARWQFSGIRMAL